MNERVAKALDLLGAAGRAPPGSVVGCSEAQVLRLEAESGMHLPGAYRDFLRLMGVRAGRFHEGTDFTYEFLPGLTRYLREEVSKAGGELAANAFAFMGHQGYIFHYFYVTGDDDPEVQGFSEGQAVSPKWSGLRFSDWLVASVEEENRFVRERGL